MKFGARVGLLLFLGLLFALIPNADGESQAGAFGPTDSDVGVFAADLPQLSGEILSDPAEALGSIDLSALFGQARLDASVTFRDEVDAAASADEPDPGEGVASTADDGVAVLQDIPVLQDSAAANLGPVVSETVASSAQETATTAGAASTSSTSTTTTSTTTTSAPPTTAASQSLADQMLAQVSFDWRSAFPGWEVEFLGERAGIRGLTYPGEQRIEIFIRGDDTVSSLHRVFAHELGHVIDVEYNSNVDRERWLAQRNISDGTPWWPSAEAPDFATGAGDFAEAFAVFEAGISTRSTVSGQPTSADLTLLRELMQG